MKETEELLSQQELSSDQSPRLVTIKAGCDTMLKDLDALLVKYESLGTKSQRSFDRMGMATQDINGMRIRLGANVGLLDAFNNASSNARIEGKLNILISEIRAGKREGSVISVQTFDTTARFERDTWDALHRDLQDVGISPTVIAEKQEFIIAWFQEAVAAGKLDEDTPAQDDSSGYNSEEGPSTDEGSFVGGSDGNFRSIIDEEVPIASESINRLAISQEMRANLIEPEVKDALAGVADSYGLRWRSPTDASRGSASSTTKEQSVQQSRDITHGDDDRSHNANGSTVEEIDKTILSLIRSLPKVPDSNAPQHLAERKAAHPKTNKFEETRPLSVSYLLYKLRGTGSTPDYILFHAIARSDAEKVRYALEQGADVNGIYYSGTKTMLQVAVHHAAKIASRRAAELAFRITQLLINRGANVNAKSSTGETALHIYAYYSSLCQGLNGGDHDKILKLLLTNGAEIDAVNNYRQTPFYMACQAGGASDPRIIRSLLDHGAQIDGVSGSSETALSHAVSRDRIDLVRLLLDQGADPNAGNENGYTALVCAVYHRRLDSVKLLLEWGAQLETQMKSGETILHYADKNHEFAITMELLYKIAQNRRSNASGKKTVSGEEENAVEAFGRSVKGETREILDIALKDAKGVGGDMIFS